MKPGDELAQEILDYDRGVAEQLLTLIVRELGGSTGEAPAAFLSRISPPATRTATSTAEWKLDFAQYERLRELGLALANRLS